MTEKGISLMDVAARDFSYSLVRVYMGCLLFEDAAHEVKPLPGNVAPTHRCNVDVAYRWCMGQDLIPVVTAHSMGLYEEEAMHAESDILYGMGKGE